jgi:hypothetical protein
MDSGGRGDGGSLDPEVAREVTSGPPCSQCKFPMEPGFLSIRSGGSVIGFLEWSDPALDADRPGQPIEGLPWGAYGRYRALRGFRCPECRRVEVAYGSPSPPVRPP